MSEHHTPTGTVARMAKGHILLVTFPGQGTINPCLQFAKRLAAHGVKVTILSATAATLPPSFPALIDVVSFSTGTESTPLAVAEFTQALSHHGSKAVEDAVAAKRAEGRPYTRIVFNLLVPWAGRVARRLGVPSTLLWIQPAIVLGVYFHHYNNSFRASDEVIQLPGLPRLRHADLPSFFQDTSPTVYDFIIPLLNENFEVLDGEDRPTVVLNTFDKLEADALRCFNKYRLLAIGPLIPSAFLDGRDPSDTSFGGDLVQETEDYLPYLESAEKESVMYVSFGSMSQLSGLQMEAIAEALIRSGRQFLWVIRGGDVSRREELEKRGKIVRWCNQVKVLSHPSVGCFVTHCGWNSTLESLASGVPVVAVPQWTDQGTNAKLVEDLWGTGVRAVKSAGAGNGDQIVEADEMVRCLEMVMGGGDASVEMRKQAKKWRDLAREAVADGGTSQLNLGIFVDELVSGRRSLV